MLCRCRHAYPDDVGLKTRLLGRMGQHLNEIAVNHAVAVVVINQMTTKFDSNGSGFGGDEARLVPALGMLDMH